jgi:hypothetical protein
MRRAAGALAIAAILSAAAAEAEQPSAVAAREQAHLQVLSERAANIVDGLDIQELERRDGKLPSRLRELIAQQYLALGKLHDAGRADAAALDALHRRFVAQLAAELPPEQVDRAKDGITYGVLPITMNAYLELLPQLTAEQRREIHAQLVEAREYAMDAGSSEEKHAVFGKYKGRINNYLSRAGYDLKQAERERAARRQASAK